MKKCINGVFLEMTDREIAAMQAEQEKLGYEPTVDERIGELEAALELLLTGVTQ